MEKNGGERARSQSFCILFQITLLYNAPIVYFERPFSHIYIVTINLPAVFVTSRPNKIIIKLYHNRSRRK